MSTNSTCIKKERLKEFDLARAFGIIAMVAVHTEFAIYNYQTPWFATLVDYLGSPYVAPVFMFILGANIYLSSHNAPKQLLKKGVSLFGISIIFNVICHALPFFILDYLNSQTMYDANALHWIFAVDILTFAGMAFVFFAAVKKFNINNWILAAIGVIASIINIILTYNFPIDFKNNIFKAATTSLFYNSSISGYFSFLSWIIFPIAGYIFINVIKDIQNKDKFYLKTGGISLFIYLTCIFISYKWYPELPFIKYVKEYSYYQMNPFNAFGTVAFCIAWISIMYFVSKIIPQVLNKHIARLNKNLTHIYFIQWFLINYCFVLISNNTFRVNEWQFILCFLAVVIASDFIAWLYTKYKEWRDR